MRSQVYTSPLFVISATLYLLLLLAAAPHIYPTHGSSVSTPEMMPKIEYAQPPPKAVISWIMTNGIAAAKSSRMLATIVSADSIAGDGKASNRYEIIEI